MKHILWLCGLLIILSSQKVRAQQADMYLRGEVSGIYAFTKESISPRNSRMQKLDLKLHAGVYLSDNWEIHAALNTYAYSGKLLKEYPPFSFLVFNRYDWLDLTHTWEDGSRALVFSRLDKAYLEYHKGRMTIRAGRQLINWGQTIVWNVNDLFNTFTLINMDDMLKQGSDAIRLSFYPAPTSVVEMAAKLNNYNELTAAVMGRTNVKGIDLQLQTGLVEDKDWMIGGALTGHIDKLGLRSEWAWYTRIDTGREVKDTWLIAMGAEFVFPNNLILQSELLYNSLDQTDPAALFSRLVSVSFNPRVRSVSKWSLACNAAYIINPSLSLWLAFAWMPDYEAATFSPAMQFKINDHLDFSLNAMYLQGYYQQERQQASYGMLKLRYVF
jgi:hypothetical protein